MTAAELEALRKTMPWRKVIFRAGVVGGQVKLIDRFGKEVPLFDMTDFLEIITAKMAAKEQEQS